MVASDANFLNGYLPYLLRQADQALSAPFYALLTSHGIARSDWRVLAVLEEHGELGVVDLAAAALSPQPTVTHALRRLERRGLVARVLGASDKRQRFASITPAGSRLARMLIGEATRLEAEALSEAGDLTDLADRLRALTARVEARAGRQEAASIDRPGTEGAGQDDVVQAG